MAKNPKKRAAYAYVLTQEHYHFPPNDADMVAATPRAIYSGTETGRIAAQVEAHKQASEHCSKFGGEVKLYKSTDSSRECFRVWVDSPSIHCDKFVWVVRRVDMA